MRKFLMLVASVTALLPALAQAAPNSFDLVMRSRVATEENSVRYHAVLEEQSWKATETAVIVCDMWDLHHCLNATRRGAELAPRMNALLKKARAQGATIIHAPSSCMKPYANHPGRKRAMAAPMASKLPEKISEWCYSIPSEEEVEYPIDQSDGGEDDDPVEHEAWAKELESKGLNPRGPWTKQTDLLTIKKEDYISDSGVEIWNVLEQKGIKNVILVGVHTNMCVLGRPFGLRQMAQNGKNVVLVRDMTDTMYNPKMKPYVSHFTGTDLIVEYIEKVVCPTVTSDQILGGKPFVFKNDTRPHVVIACAEREYKTNESLPGFALEQLGNDFKVSFVHANANERNDLPGIGVLENADVLLVSVRRRVLPADQFAIVEKFIKSGKPVIGIRTANHAFSLHGEDPPSGYKAWEAFDAEIFGGSYTGHHGVGPNVKLAAAKPHPIMTGVDVNTFKGMGSLYKVNPLSKGTTPLLTGTIEGQPVETIAWVNETKYGGKAFYTSLGHVDDFTQPAMNRLLKNAILWAADKEIK